MNARGKRFITYGASATIVILAPANLFSIHTTIFAINKNTPFTHHFSDYMKTPDISQQASSPYAGNPLLAGQHVYYSPLFL